MIDKCDFPLNNFGEASLKVFDKVFLESLIILIIPRRKDYIKSPIEYWLLTSCMKYYYYQTPPM